MLAVLIATIPIIITSLFIAIYNKKSIKNINFNKVLDVILCGFLSVILVLPICKVLEVPLASTISALTIDTSKISFLLIFVTYLFRAGIPEEIAKWIAVKSSRAKNPYNILINSIYISLIFMILENYAKANAKASMGMLISVDVYRIFIPVHIICQLVMALLLIKAHENKKSGNKTKAIFFNILSIIVPIFIHTSYNTFTSMDIIPIIYFVSTIIVLGICAYIATFIAIAKVTKKYYIEEASKEKINKIKLFLVIILSIISVIIFRA